MIFGKMNKKAMSTDFLIAIAAVIIGFLVIVWTLKPVIANADEREAESWCQNSVALRAASSINVKETNTKSIPTLCKTIDKKVSGNKEEVKKVFAAKIAECWEMFGAGRYKTNILQSLDIFGSDNLCFMCYSLMLDEIKDAPSISDQEFHKYISTQPYPKLKDTTYLDYLQYKGGGKGYLIKVLDEKGLVPGRAYSIIYKARAKDCGSICSILTVGGGTAAGLGTVTTLVFGIGTGGVGLIIVGGAALLTGVTVMVDDLFSSQSNVDSIWLVDMSNEEFNKEFSARCPLVADVAGS